MKKHRAMIFIIILLVITGIMAMVYLNDREDIPENAIELSVRSESQYIDIEKIKYENVSGSRVNGKGEKIEVNASGLSLEKVLNDDGITEYDTISVVADDAYSAEITAKEMQDGLEAYLIQEEGEERLRLVVFGDKDSKRSVSNVAQIVVE